LLALSRDVWLWSPFSCDVILTFCQAGGFDIVLTNMAIMDIATLEPLANALPGLLAKDGMYVI